MNHDEFTTTAYAAKVQARREEFERQLRGDYDLTLPHGAKQEPRAWPQSHLLVVLFYLLLFVAAVVVVGQVSG